MGPCEACHALYKWTAGRLKYFVMKLASVLPRTGVETGGIPARYIAFSARFTGNQPLLSNHCLVLKLIVSIFILHFGRFVPFLLLPPAMCIVWQWLSSRSRYLFTSSSSNARTQARTWALSTFPEIPKKWMNPWRPSTSSGEIPNSATVATSLEAYNRALTMVLLYSFPCPSVPFANAVCILNPSISSVTIIVFIVSYRTSPGSPPSTT